MNEKFFKTISNDHSLPFPLSIFNNINKERLKNNLLIFTLLNLLWLIFRTGTRPSRLTYPCQQVALNNFSTSLGAFIPLSITNTFFTTPKNFISRNRIIILAILILGVISGGLFLRTLTPNPSQKLQLILESQHATVFPASDIYVVNGTNAHISELINLMSSNEMFFYNTRVVGENQGPEGLIAKDDVVLLKINSQWSERGGTNTDVLLELIQTIVDHPDGFDGEIVVADNGQGRGSMNYGVTASIKNYMGVQSEIVAGGLANGHVTVGTGGMGTLLVECGLPTLNIIDAIWVNANPYPSWSTGPGTSYSEATRLDMLIAGVDPIALDYWAAKHVLIQAAQLIGYDDTDTLDPENAEKNGLKEGFGAWLTLTKNEIIRGGINVTADESRMNILYNNQNVTHTSSSSSISTTGVITSTKSTRGFELFCMILSLTVTIPLFLRKRGKRSN